MKIQLKRSNVLQSGAAKEPTASQLAYGELAINYSSSDPAIFLKDSNNNIIRISGIGNIADDGIANVPAGTTPPTSPTPEAGNLWYNSDEGRLYIYYVDANTSQWVDASPDSWDPTVLPVTTNPAAQSGTLDDRYVMESGDTMTGNLVMNNANIVFEGATADDFETQITVADPTSDNTITFPDVTGNVVTTGDTGSVTATMIADGTIANAEISTTAEIAVSKLANGTARQVLQTDSAGTGVEFSSDIDIPGTLDVTGAATFDSTLQASGAATFSSTLQASGAATFDSTLQVDGVATFNDNIVMEGTSADAHELTLTCNPTSDVTVTLPDATTTVAGLAVTQNFTKAQRGDVVTLTDAAIISVDLSLGNNFAVQLGGNRTLGDPTNATAGQSGVIVVTQDGTGSRTLAYAGSKWKFAGGTAPTLTAGSGGAVDVLAYYVESSTRITVTSLGNVS